MGERARLLQPLSSKKLFGQFPVPAPADHGSIAHQLRHSAQSYSAMRSCIPRFTEPKAPPPNLFQQAMELKLRQEQEDFALQHAGSRLDLHKSIAGDVQRVRAARPHATVPRLRGLPARSPAASRAHSRAFHLRDLHCVEAERAPAGSVSARAPTASRPGAADVRLQQQLPPHHQQASSQVLGEHAVRALSAPHGTPARLAADDPARPRRRRDKRRTQRPRAGSVHAADERTRDRQLLPERRALPVPESSRRQHRPPKHRTSGNLSAAALAAAADSLQLGWKNRSSGRLLKPPKHTGLGSLQEQTATLLERERGSGSTERHT